MPLAAADLHTMIGRWAALDRAALLEAPGPRRTGGTPPGRT